MAGVLGASDFMIVIQSAKELSECVGPFFSGLLVEEAVLALFEINHA